MHTTHSNTQYKNESSTAKWAHWDKTQSRELLVCSYVCASHCAQLLHTTLHRTDLIVFPLTLQTITTSPMMSIWGKGGKPVNGISWSPRKILVKDLRQRSGLAWFCACTESCVVFNTGPYTVLPDNSILITANMQSETGFPSSHQLKFYVASKSRLKLAARAVLSADAGPLVIITWVCQLVTWDLLTYLLPAALRAMQAAGI